MYPQQNQPPYGVPAQYGPPQPPPSRGRFSKVALIVIVGMGALCLVAMAGGNKQRGATSNTTGAESTQASPGRAPAPSSHEAQAPADPASPPAAPSGAAAQVATGERLDDAVPRGTPVTVEGLEATLLSARFAQRVGRNQFLRHTAPEGARLLVLSYRVRNTRNEPITVMSFADSVIAQGVTYNPTPACDMAINTLGPGNPLNPNIPRTFEACFEVPMEGTGFVVKFNRSLTDRFVQTGL